MQYIQMRPVTDIFSMHKIILAMPDDMTEDEIDELANKIDYYWDYTTIVDYNDFVENCK